MAGNAHAAGYPSASAGFEPSLPPIRLVSIGVLGPQHPYLAGGMAVDTHRVGFGQNDAFVYQARAFLEEVRAVATDEPLPACATFHNGVHNMQILAAVPESAGNTDRKSVV